MPNSGFSTDEQQMKLLKDKALFSDSYHTRIQSLRSLAAFGHDATPFVSEVLESTTDEGFRRYCSELLERINSTHSKRIIGAILALTPYIILGSCPLDFISL